MKRLLSSSFVKVMFVAVFLFGVQSVLAHPGGHHKPINATQAKATALRAVKAYSHRDVGMSIGQLPESWRALPPASATIHKSSDTYYIVAVTNAELEKTLYVFMSESGDVVDANYTGEFASSEEH